PVDPVGAASSDKRWKINCRQPVGAASYNKIATLEDQLAATSWRSILQICAFQLECGYGKLF
ncbi:MAG: hypothetical protein WCS37_22855, partial [Chloroflexota bacterium]